ncbi:hypothetical protein FSP39_012189 [Pinctada imbricata]|uniref:TIR domain-containing protein n=1 Tax=Pinctada imbricata TaxID=66713 RepID=A0AA88XRU2_PINIB|nr:hypothetical protein FSP39_012189 [Pinctada imbricata]
MKQRRGSPTTPGCSTHSKTPMQKHKADKHKKRRARDKERQRTTQKHQTHRTTHNPTRPMGNRCRLKTAICHGYSRSDENKEFVLDEMVRELEEVSQLRLCLSGRDFRPGVSIAENITRAINKSKKTIVIMSVDYLLSYWCMYELNMARMESLYSRSDQDVLMMIVLEKVAFQNAPHVVLELINNNSFLEYPDDQHGKFYFGRKLERRLLR